MLGKCKKCGYQAGLFGLKKGLCKSCQTKGDESEGGRAVELARIGLRIVEYQIEVAKIEKSQLTDDFEIGYIFGAMDASLIGGGFTNQSDESLPALTVGFLEFYGGLSGAEHFRRALDIQSTSNDFYSGNYTGGNDFASAIKNSTPAIGLAEYVLSKT